MAFTAFVVLMLVAYVNCQDMHGYFHEDKGIPIGLSELGDHIVYIVSEEALFIDLLKLSDLPKDYYFELNGIKFNEIREIKEPEGILIVLPEGEKISLRNNSSLNLVSNNRTSPYNLLHPIPNNVPQPLLLPPISQLDHGVKSGNITILNGNSIFISNFYYDGLAPDAYFWTGNGSVNSDGIHVPDENGSYKILGEYKGKDVLLTLPLNLSIYNVDYMSVYCLQYSVDFGNVRIPKNIRVPPSMYTPPLPHSEVLPDNSSSSASGGVYAFTVSIIYFTLSNMFSRVI